MSLRRDFIKIPLTLAGAAVFAVPALPASAQPVQLLNVSYDPTRELYAEFDQAFGGWARAGKEHFADGGSFDQVYARK